MNCKKAKQKAKKREQALKIEKQKRREREEQAEKEAHIKEVTRMDLPLDWENAFTGDSRTQGVHTENIPDALIMSLSILGRVDIEYISSVTGEDCKTIICALYSMNKSFLNYHSDRKVISRIAESQYSVVKRLGP